MSVESWSSNVLYQNNQLGKSLGQVGREILNIEYQNDDSVE